MGRSSIIKEPPPPPASSSLRDDDSSATASADEGQNGVSGGRDSPPEVQHIPHPGERRPGHKVYLNRPGMPLVTTTVSPLSSASSSPAPNFKQIIDNTIESTIARSSKHHRKGTTEGFSHPHTDHITITSLLEHPSVTAPQTSSSSSSVSASSGQGHSSSSAAAAVVIPGGVSQPLVSLTTTSFSQSSSNHYQKLMVTSSGGSSSSSSHSRNWPPTTAVVSIYSSSGGSEGYHPHHRHSSGTTQATTPANYEECEGLDLTVKKRNRSPPAPLHSPIPQAPPTLTMRGGAEVIPTINSRSNSPPRAHSNSISYSQTLHPPSPLDHRLSYISNYRNSVVEPRNLPPTASNLSSRVPSPHYVGHHVSFPSTKNLKQTMAPPSSVPSSRVTYAHSASASTSLAAPIRIPLKPEKTLAPSRGSITHGTSSVNQHPPIGLTSGRYEIITKTPVVTREGGSITQGTPIHHDTKRGTTIGASKDPPLMVDSRSGVEIIPRPVYDRESYRTNSLPPPSRSTISTTTSYHPSYPPYSGFTYSPVRSPYSDSQISSRQIIETDYLTSQQMANRREKDLRLSPRGGREPLPRDHRGGYPIVASVGDRRQLDSHRRELEVHPAQRTSSDPPPPPPALDLRDLRSPSTESDKLHKVQFVRTSSGYVQSGGQQSQPQQQLYQLGGGVEARVSRPSPILGRGDPALISHATTVPGTVSPHREYRSSSGNSSVAVSAPTPPPRLSSVIQRQPKLPLHLSSASSKVGSPRPDGDRYSPHGRHHFAVVTSVGGGGGESMAAEVIARPSVSYPGLEVRRESRPNYIAGQSYDRHLLDGIGKQMADTLQNNRNYISGGGDLTIGREREKDRHDDRRFYDHRIDYNRARHRDADFRTAATLLNVKGPLSKDPTSGAGEDGDPKAHGGFNYQIDLTTKGGTSTPQSSFPAGVKSGSGRGGGGGQDTETLTAANLIEAIITNHINQGHLEETGRGDPRDHRIPNFRRDGDHYGGGGGPLSALEVEKRNRSPASLFHNSKEKDVVSLDGPNDLSVLHRHKGGSDGGAHPAVAHHPLVHGKHNQAHLEISDPKKMGSSGLTVSSPYGRSPIPPPLEITRADGRGALAHMGGHYDHSKMRPHSATVSPVALQQQQSRRSPPESAPGSVKDGNSSRPGSLVPDERHIIRIAQPPPPPPRSDNPFDYIKNKLQEIWREDTPPDRSASPDKRALHDVSKINSRSASMLGRPGGHPPFSHAPPHHQPPPPMQARSFQQHHYDEDPARKRLRIDPTSDLSRPRSTSGDLVRPASRDTKDEVADSPQSGEMVIDETPKGVGVDVSKMSPSPGGVVSPIGATSDKSRSGIPPQTIIPPQYSNAYPVYRSAAVAAANSSGGPVVSLRMSSSSGGGGASNPAVATNLSTSTGSAPRGSQGYEPNVEPVSDDDS